MKKLFLTAAVLLFGMAVARTEMVDVPSANTMQGASIYYGGVYYSTAAFNSDYSTVAYNTGGVFYGVIFSSGNAGAGDFVDVWDSSAVVANTGRQIARLYNVSGSTASAPANTSAVSGFSGTIYPIRFFRGLIIKANTNGYNMITTLYYKSKE